MNFLAYVARLAASIERRIERGQQQTDEAYLSRSTDHADLELRMRELERAPIWIPHYC
jgi:hypothetical protein